MKKKLVFSLIFAFIVVFVTLLLFKNKIITNIIYSKIEAYNKTYVGKITIKNISVSGINKISIDSLYFISPYDTIGTIDSLSVTINPLRSIFGNISLENIVCKNILFNIVKYDSIQNFTTLFLKKHQSDTGSSYKTVPLNRQAKLLFNFIFDILPEDAEIKNISITYHRKLKDNITLYIPFIRKTNQKLLLPLYLKDNKNNQLFKIASILDANKRTIYTKLISHYSKNEFFPGFKDKNFKLFIDTAYFSFIENIQEDIISLKGNGKLLNVLINQPSVSLKDIFFEKLSLDYDIKITDNAIILDSTSKVHINKLTITPYVRYQHSPTKQIQIDIIPRPFEAQQLFSSLPEGLFPNTYNIKASGFLSYKLHFFLDFSQIDSLKLESELIPYKFKIISFGSLDINKLNNEINHTIYENGDSIDHIWISPSNPHYVPLNNISPYLRNAILCTEDGAFYWHKGFILEAFRNALITNIKYKRFIRGGSTITMQLVKNLYLNKYKTISRKLEEMLIVWLIENLGLCSKDKMFELYFNIIEFGPRVYGVYKGTKFYFNKTPNQLSLPEAIFIASIIPKPKHFAASFDSTGSLKPNVQEFLKFVANRMYQKQMISEQELNNFIPSVQLIGNAKNYLKTSADSTLYKQFFNENYY